MAEEDGESDVAQEELIIRVGRVSDKTEEAWVGVEVEVEGFLGLKVGFTADRPECLETDRLGEAAAELLLLLGVLIDFERKLIFSLLTFERELELEQ